MLTTPFDFPPTLPCPLRDNYDLGQPDTFRRVELASGRAAQEQTHTSVPTMMDVQWLFSDSDYAAFSAWYFDVIAAGAAWFNVPIRSPFGLQTPVVARFRARYRGPTLVGRSSWRVTAQLETFEPLRLPPGWGLVPEIVAGMDIFDVAMNREWPEA